jgi:hypothetical protein
VLISPAVYDYRADADGAWNSICCVILDIIVAVLTSIRLSDVYRQVWLSWANAILGLWLIISPWVCGYANNAGGAWNSVILGIIISILAAGAHGHLLRHRTTPLNVRE